MNKAELILVEIAPFGERLIRATSPSMTGLLLLAPSEEELAADLPACIKRLYEYEHKTTVAVWPVEGDTNTWVIVPT